MPLHFPRALFAIVAACTFATAAAAELPARFESGLVYLQVPGEAGDLLLYTDTGGGMFLRQAAVERLRLPTDDAPAGLVEELGPDTRITPWPELLTAAGIAAPLQADTSLLVMPTGAAGELPGTRDDDGMLGQAWFGGRVWTWDYPGKRLRLEPAGWQAPADAVRVPLQFKIGADGTRENSFPRIVATIDGQPVPLLLDTGAMTVLAPAALAALDDGLPAQRATSMISDTLFRAWRQAHPEWRVIEKAQAGTGSAMIEVPSLELAGQRIGPVWFTHRPDANFHRFMSGMMAARVEGALGGNALGHFVMTVDYPAAAAWFRCVAQCAEAPASADASRSGQDR